MRPRGWNAALWAFVAVGCGGDGGEHPDADATCLVDSDGDGLIDCQDDDDDNDGLRDADEAAAGTDPLDPDSDRDGLTDFDEVMVDRSYTPAGTTTTATRYTDPTTPTLLVEIDFVTGYRPSDATLAATAAAFTAAGVETVLLIGDGSPIAPGSLPAGTWTAADLETVLQASDDQTDYLHVVFAPGDGTSKHGTSHYPVPNDPASGGYGNAPPTSAAGSLVFAGTIAADHATYQTVFGPAGITVDLLVARTLIHELGHLVGCTEEGPSDGYDSFNVMTQNSALGNPTSAIQPWIDNLLGPGGVGHPVFAAGSLAQIDLTHKASVDVATSPSLRAFDMGTATSRIRPGYFQVTEASRYARGWGFLDPLPTVSAAAGSDPNDERFEDYVAGDPAVTGSTRFRMTGLGTAETGVFFRLGAQLTSPLRVRCQITHPTRGVTWIADTLDAGNRFVATPSSGYRVYPVEVEATSLGYSHTEIVLECLDASPYGDAPIETVVMTKREP